LEDDFVLLTPMDILTKDQTWLNRPELIDTLPQIVQAAENDELRAKLNNYLQRRIGDHDRRRRLKQTEIRQIHADAVREHPEIVDHYIAQKEETGDEAKKVGASGSRVGS
jgi:Fe-S cluster assembly scaffold protein SufB